MPQFTTRTLALADDTHDRTHASDGHSRYGTYLDLNAGLLHDDGHPLTAAGFAFSAWQIATSPVMAPGYVRVRPDLHSLTVVSAGDDGRDVALRITVPLRHRALAAWPARMVADWQADPWATDRGFTALAEPEPAGRTALLVTATVLLPVPAHVLHTPTAAEPSPEMTRQAKQAVKALTRWTNDHAHLVNDLCAGAER
ncbi:hypothetical protein [Kitasatospora terrestris]|uniref:Uncharacterized protein n=1 Tax=Kitasatospora terrestris TaxID=258051 RepID=A0ABP9E5A6_9ACTN